MRIEIADSVEDLTQLSADILAEPLSDDPRTFGLAGDKPLGPSTASYGPGMWRGIR